MKPTIKLTETPTTTAGAQIWNQKFYTMPLIEIENVLQDELQSYYSAGYNSFMFHRQTGTVSVRKIAVQTMKDVFETDSFGLLETKF